MRLAGRVDVALTLLAAGLRRLQGRVRQRTPVAGLPQPGPGRRPAGGELLQPAELPERLLQRPGRGRAVARRAGVAVGLLGGLQGRRRLRQRAGGGPPARVEPVHPVGDGHRGQGGVLLAQLAGPPPGGFRGARGVIPLRAQHLQRGAGLGHRGVGGGRPGRQARGLIAAGRLAGDVLAAPRALLPDQLQRRSLRAFGQRLAGPAVLLQGQFLGAARLVQGRAGGADPLAERGDVVGEAHRGQRRPVLLQLRQVALGGHELLVGRVDLRHGRLRPLGQPGQGGLVGAHRILGVLRGVAQGGQGLVEGLGPLRGVAGPLVGPDHHLLVVLGTEQPQQDLLPLARRGVQEVGELALREHHALAEVLVGQPEQPFHGVGHPRQVLGQDLGRLARLGPAAPVGQPLQARGPLAHLAAGPAQLAGHHVTLVADLEHELHGAAGGGRRERERDHALAAPPRHRAVQRERHRVDDRRLARAGGADQGEEVRVGEVDPGRLPERGEPVHLQHDRSHRRLFLSPGRYRWRTR